MTILDEDGQRLLGLLASHLKHVEPGDPSTYIGYKEVHDKLGLRLVSEAGYGASLKMQGLNSLAGWSFEQGLPAITGIIIDRSKFSPGKGYFRLFKKDAIDDIPWWTEQVRLSKEYVWTPYLSDAALPDSPPASDINEPPDREEIKIYRILRDTNLAKRIKTKYRYTCQIKTCQYRIELPDGSGYAEAHHIRPLGRPHNGPDSNDNIICLCPNHHAELDYGVLRLEIDNIFLAPGHQLNAEHIKYHNESIYMRPQQNL